MARLIPPYIDKNCKSSAEKLIFSILKNSTLTKDWIILHSLNLSQHVTRLYGEIDFLLLIPHGGIFVMEVKGGGVRCVDGRWEYTDRYGNKYFNKSPFNQARDAMFSLRTSLEKEFGFNHKYTRILTGFLCAFPNINFDKHSVEYEPWQIIDRDIINSDIEIFFKRLVLNFKDKYKNQRWFSETESLPDSKDLNIICDFLRGDFERIQPLNDKLSNFNQEIQKYTNEQFRILDSIEINKRSLIQGRAGTGKTLIAIESAKRSASKGYNVLLTCYNKLIGDWMRSQLLEWKDKITVYSLHKYLHVVSNGLDIEKNREDYYEVYLPNIVKDIFHKGIIKKFDKIIIDEGQDLIRKEYLDLFDSMLGNGLTNGVWEIYGDFEKQAIYSTISKEEMYHLVDNVANYSRFILKVNCRNTKQIGEETSLITGFERPIFLLQNLDGPPVEYFFYKNKVHQIKLITNQINKLIENKLSLKELIILSPKKLSNSCLNAFEGYKINNLKSEFPSEREINFSTIHSFKGMESNYIMLTDIEDLETDLGKSLLYIGMSRAKYGLMVYIEEAKKKDYKEILSKCLGLYEK